MKRILTIIGLFLFLTGYAQKSDKIEYLRVDSLLYSGSLSNPDTLIVPHPDSANQYKFMNMADPVNDRDGVPLGYFNTNALVALTVTDIKTANYTAGENEYIQCNIIGSGFTLTLPDTPSDGTRIIIQVLNSATSDNSLLIQASGSDVLAVLGGPTFLNVSLSLETVSLQYTSATSVWQAENTAPPARFATNFPGIDAQTPIGSGDISIDYNTRILTITPPDGYFDFQVDGNGRSTQYTKYTSVSFPAFTDNSGIWYFSFDADGNTVTSQTPWSDFSTTVAIYRLLWNSTLSGSAKSIVEAIETHENTISAADHQWKHRYGTIWLNGFTCFHNAITSGAPVAGGNETVVSFNTGYNMDDNLMYTVENSTGGLDWQQDLGEETPASIDNTNSALLTVKYRDTPGLIYTLPATRFPFAWDTGTNRPEYITTSGVRTLVTNGDFFVNFVYGIQDPRNGEGLTIVSVPEEFSTLTEAQAYNWTDLQGEFPLVNDGEVRPLYKFIHEYKTTYGVTNKYSALREVTDIRKQEVTQSGTLAGTINATQVINSPTGDIGATNVQAAITELDTEKAARTEIIDTIYTKEDGVFSIDSLLYDINGTPYYITSIPKEDGRKEGGLVLWQSGLTYDVSPCLYYINGTEYQTSSETVTLSTADPTNARIDVIVVDTFNQVDVIEGTPAATPVKPTVDPLSQIELTFANVAAGATEPTPGGGGTVADSVIYNENVEWTGAGVGVTVDFASVADPYIGTISADVGSMGSDDAITFTSSGDHTSEFDVFSFFIKLNTALPASLKSKIYVEFLYDGQLVSNSQTVIFDRSSIDWQNVSASNSDFTFTNSVFDEVKISIFQKSGVPVDGFYLDYVKVQGGYKQPATEALPVDLYVRDTLRESGISKLNFLDGDNTIVDYTPNGNVSITVPVDPLIADSLSITNGATVGGNTEVDGYVLATINSDGARTFPLRVANTGATIGTEGGLKLGASTAPGIRYAAITGYQEGSNTTNVKIYTGQGGTLTEIVDMDGNNGTSTFSYNVKAPAYGTTEQPLTETAGAVAWDVADGSEVGVTIDETSIITLTNIPVGWKGNIDITQGDAGDDNVTFVSSGYTVKWRGDDTDLTDDSGAIDVVSLRVRGAIIYVTLGSGYVDQ